MRINADKIKLLQASETQKDFANRAGISRQGYSNVLARGTCAPLTLIKIASALDVDPEELIRTEV